MFARERHRRILTLLHSLDGDFLHRAGCWFCGGTAAVLLLGEYRESADVDFVCADAAGYRALRNAVTPEGLGPLLARPVPLLRDVRADQYGIRTVLDIDGTPIRFEIFREARIAVDGALHPEWGVPVLSRADMFAEKLLANADRWLDRATLSRDIIDLAMMAEAWGGIPAEALDKARAAYGAAADRAFAGAVTLIQDRDWLARCMTTMAMDPDLADRLVAVFAPDPDGLSPV